MTRSWGGLLIVIAGVAIAGCSKSSTEPQAPVAQQQAQADALANYNAERDELARLKKLKAECEQTFSGIEREMTAEIQSRKDLEAEAENEAVRKIAANSIERLQKDLQDTRDSYQSELDSLNANITRQADKVDEAKAAIDVRPHRTPATQADRP